MVEFFWQLVSRIEIFVKVVDRTGHRRAASTGVKRLPTHRRKMGVMNESWLGRGEFLDAGVVRRLVDRVRRSKSLERFLLTEIISIVSPIIGDEVRPPEISGTTSLVYLIIASRATTITSPTSIGADLAPVQVAGFGVD